LGTPQRKSLRFRYLRFAAVLASILLAGATYSSFYISRITHENSASLQLSDTANELVDDARGALWVATATLTSKLISPQAEHEEIIKNNLLKAEASITELSSLASIQEVGISDDIKDVQIDLENLKYYILQLLESGKDPNWIYPMLPYINEKLLESNTEFESAAVLAMQEIADDDGADYGSKLYRDIAQIRDLWRQIILNFRAIIIRFAGLNRVEKIAQIKNIDILHSEVKNKLRNLQKLKEQGLLGFETTDALIVMQHSSKQWYDDYKKLRTIQDSKVWRADIYYTENIINPIQKDIARDLSDLDNSVHAWSALNVKAVEKAANQLILELWILTGTAIIFVWLVYTMIARGVLSPIAKISDAIAEDINKIDSLSTDNRSSKEIHTLVSAFNSMRNQIHHRQTALEHQALHDSLTGLPNRALLQDRLEQAVNIAQRQNSNVAVMLLDLDRFKDINDTLGHPVGDLVLQEIGSRLEACLRTSDTVARLGGDEFAVICPSIDNKEVKSFVEKIIDCTSKVVSINNQNLYTGASIGISLYPTNADDADALIRQADVAMYSAKHRGLDYTFYTSELDQLNADNLSLLGDLREELKKPTGQLSLHYQPQINLQTNKMHGSEALLRWNHPEKGLIPAAEVIRMTEQTSLIDDLTLWVIERAIKDFKICKEGGSCINISVNLSVRNLQNPELPSLIQELLSKHKMDPGHLTLEITESAIMSDPVRARENLNLLSGMGVQMDIDDYGTGFSSLAYLKMLPVNGLKIDKSFVIDMLEDENDITIVKSTIDLGHNLHLSVIAEGVETAEVYQHLKDSQCDFAQGAYIACPMPADELQQWCKDFDPNSL
jgi:diguanylate cyclase (GGDEF)-like protein